MNNKNKAVLGVFALIMAFNPVLPTQAADVQDKQTAPAAKAPITIEADELYFKDQTGDLFAKGNVSVEQNQDKILSEFIQGNSQRQEVWADGKATLIQPNAKYEGIGSKYNFQTHAGSMQQVSGNIGKALIKGQKIELQPNLVQLQDGSVTTCTAKVPDYHISAKKVEIWPGDKMIAYDAKFWIKDKVIFSLSKFEQSLKENNGVSVFPRLGYDSDDGFMIAQYLAYPFSSRLSAFADFSYFTKAGYKPVYGLENKNKEYTIKLIEGYQRNDDNEWIKKEPEFSLETNKFRIGNLPLAASFAASTGKWTEGSISGWTQKYKFDLKHAPISLSKATTLNVGTGFESTHYGYDNSNNDIWYYNVKFDVKPNDRLEYWAGYNHNKESGTSVYKYDEIDVEHEIIAGFKYQVDRLNGVGIKTSYDASEDHFKDIDYTWTHNLHCFQTDVTYRAKRDQWTFKVSALNF